MAEDLLGIGETARRSGLTVKALRYYDRIALLQPAVTDQTTGFRYFSHDQGDIARLIGKLRSVDLPIDDIRPCLDSDDREAVINTVLLNHETRESGSSATRAMPSPTRPSRAVTRLPVTQKPHAP